MAQTSTQELQKIEKLVVKLRNKLKRADLDYTVQISINSTDPTVVTYAAQVTAPANGLAPITFLDKSLEGLADKVKVAAENINYDEVEKAYHEAQIEACHRTIKGHEERLEALTKTDSEEASTEPVPVADSESKENV